MKLPKINFTKLIAAILLCQSAGIIGSLFTFPAISSWYIYLEKPFFSPPNWLFGPVWTALYTLMGISLYLIWTKKLNKNTQIKTLKPFWMQLILNSSWSIAFFGLKSPELGLLIIILLWYFIYQTIIKFNKVSKLSGSLLIPYLLWVSFAALLNLAIVVLN